MADFDRATFDGVGATSTAWAAARWAARRGGSPSCAACSPRRGAGRGLSRGVRVAVPAAVVVATDVFDRFLDDNRPARLRARAPDDAELRRRFEAARFPDDVRRDLRAFLERRAPSARGAVVEPARGLAVPAVHRRLRDAHAGQRRRRRRTCAWTSWCGRSSACTPPPSRGRPRTTSAPRPTAWRRRRWRCILQRVVGARARRALLSRLRGRGALAQLLPVAAADRARTASPPSRSGWDGRWWTAAPACASRPRHPQRLVQFSSVADALENSQRTFWALELGAGGDAGESRSACSASTPRKRTARWPASPPPGRARTTPSTTACRAPGVRLVTFAPVLKHRTFPLAEILDRVLDLGAWGMGAPVEIEFAVTLSDAARARRGSSASCSCGRSPCRGSARSSRSARWRADALICRSAQRARATAASTTCGTWSWWTASASTARQSRETAARARALQRRAGRARAGPTSCSASGAGDRAIPGSGIPVAWDQISGARVIVEAGFRDLRVTPSQGTHFFQNLTSFNVGYFTVNPDVGEGFVDWDWLAAQPALREARLRAPPALRAPGGGDDGRPARRGRDRQAGRRLATTETDVHEHEHGINE